jgi:putative oxidoreductase
MKCYVKEEKVMTSSLDMAITIMRILIGALMFGHGAQKLFGWFGGPGMAGATGMMNHLGFRPAPFWAWMLALLEVLGGLSLVFGFLTPIGAAALLADMIVAAVKVHAPKGIWNMGGGVEYNLVLIAALLVIGLAGPTLYSVDRYVNVVSWTPTTLFFAALAASLFGIFVAFLTTTQPAASPRQTTQSR